MSISYSVLSYGYDALHSEKASAEIKDVVKALHAYYHAAYRFVPR